MRKLSVVALFCAGTVLLGSCDAFRKLAGRPTSADIEAKRQLIEAERSAHLDRLDTMDSVYRQLSDSVAAVDSMRISANVKVESRSLSVQSRVQLTHRYYVVVGAFGKYDNAVRCAEDYGQKGYASKLIGYANGFTAVGICPTDNLSEAYASLVRVRDAGLCSDAWILDNR